MTPTKGKEISITTEVQTRGPTIYKKVIRKRHKQQKFELQWSVKGLPCGDNRPKLGSFIGVCARRRIPITYDSWDKVPKELKNLIWDEILTVFDIPQDKKKWLLQRAGERWKEFKSRLRRLFAFNKDGTMRKMPPPTYDFIKTSDWSIFLTELSSNTFQEKSEMYRTRAKQNTCRPKCSRKGYIGIEEEMLRENNLDPKTSKIDRGLLWKRARTDISGVMEEDAQEVADRMHELKSQVSEGLVTKEGCDDVLSMALGKKDHSGHPIATGPGVTKTTYLAPISKTDTEIAYLKKIVNDLVTKFDVFQSSKDCTKKEPEKEVLINHSVKASCSVAIFSNLPPGSTGCKLRLDNPMRVVARGAVITPNKGEPEMLHNLPLDPLCKKVHILTIVKGMESANVPVPNELADVFELKDFPGNILVWPMELIDLELEGSSPARSKSPNPTSPDKKGTADVVEHDKQFDNMPTKVSVVVANVNKVVAEQDATTENIPSKKRMIYLKMLNFYAVEEIQASDIIMIELPKDIVGNQISIPITSDEIKKWYNQQHVELSHMSVFIKVLFDKIKKVGDEKRFQFICLHYMSSGNGHDDQERKRHLATSFERGTNESIFLVPYSVSQHWIFCVIDPKLHTCYWLDPLRGPVRPDMKEIVDMGLKIYKAKHGGDKQQRKNVKWNVIKCPRQSSDSIACGYYVMRFMKEIVENIKRSVPTEYLCGYNGRAYKQNEIDEIREQWAAYIHK